MTKILSIETSTKHFSLAISNGPKILAYRNIKLRKVLSSAVIPAIQQILGRAGASLSFIDAFAIGLGPGSFTSLRVGLSTIKGLAFATGKPVIGIPSLDILAMNAPGEPKKQICVLCDARRNLGYAALYRNSKGRLKRTSKYLLTDIRDLLSMIKEDTFFIGDGIKLFKDQIVDLSKTKSMQSPEGWRPCFADEKMWYPRAQNLSLLALERFRKQKFDNVTRLTPLYLYPADCQVKQHK